MAPQIPADYFPGKVAPTLDTKRAYVTFLAGSGDYVKGVVGLAKGLRKVKSAYPLVVAILPDVPEEHREILREQGCIVKEIEPIYPPDNQIQFAMAYYVINYSKLRIWNFLEYNKMVYLDADIQVYENIDHLFDLTDGYFYAVMDCFCEKTWSHSKQYSIGYCQQVPNKVTWPAEMGSPPPLYFNAGMFVYEPNKETYENLLETLRITPPTPFAEQDFLNMFFNSIYKPIPNVYNLVLANIWRHPENVELEKVKVVHYCAAGSKPWRYTGVEENMDRADIKMLVEKWFDVYDDESLDYNGEDFSKASILASMPEPAVSYIPAPSPMKKKEKSSESTKRTGPSCDGEAAEPQPPMKNKEKSNESAKCTDPSCDGEAAEPRPSMKNTEKSSKSTKCTGDSCDGEAAEPQPAKGNSKSEGKDTDDDVDVDGTGNDKDGDDGGGDDDDDDDDDDSSPPPTKKKPESNETTNGDAKQALEKCEGPTCGDDSKMASPPTAPSERGKEAKPMASPPTNGKQGPKKNGSAKQAPPKNCDGPSCGNDYEMAPSPKAPSAKGKDDKSTAPPPTNEKQILDELEDGDVAQAPESDDPEMDLPSKVQPNKGNGEKSATPPPTNGKQIPKELEDGDAVQAPKGADYPEMELPPNVPFTKGKGSKSVAPAPTNGKHIPKELKNGKEEQESEDDDPEMELFPEVNVPNTKGKGISVKPMAPPPINGKLKPKELKNENAEQAPLEEDHEMELPQVPTTKETGAKPTAPPPVNGKQKAKGNAKQAPKDEDSEMELPLVPTTEGKSAKPTAPPPMIGKQKNKGDAEQGPEDDEPEMDFPSKPPSTKGIGANPTAPPPTNGKETPKGLKIDYAEQAEDDNPDVALPPKVPSTKEGNAKSTAPPPRNRKQISKELKNVDDELEPDYGNPETATRMKIPSAAGKDDKPIAPPPAHSNSTCDCWDNLCK